MTGVEIAEAAVAAATIASIAGVAAEVVFVVFNFLEADANEGEDFLAEDVLLTSGSSSSGSSWCFRLDLFLAAAASPTGVFEVEEEAAAGFASLRWCGMEVSESVSDSDSTSSELLGLEGVFRCFFRVVLVVCAVVVVVVAALLIAPP